MQKIAALIDFTPTTDVVIDFAKNLALQKGAQVCLVTAIEEASEKEETEQKMRPYEQVLTEAGVSCRTELVIGHFFDVISPFVDKIHADLAIVGTHGKRGLRQNLFGSFILKLVKALQIPSLVVQDSSVWPEGGFTKAFFPIASHSHFEMKIEQTNRVLADGGKLTLYAIYKTDSLDDKLKKNIQLSIDLFEKEKIDFEVVEEDVQLYSVGYSRQSLVYATEHNMQLISIMAQVSKDNKFFGNADKENVILNPAGIPVLCCNDEEEHF